MRTYLLRFGLPWFLFSLLAWLPQFLWDANELRLFSFPIDKFQHFTAGSALGVFGALLYPLFGGRKYFATHLAQNMTILLATLCGCAGGALWEVCEATIPALGAMPIPLEDTIWDLVADTAGAFVIGVLYAEIKAWR